MTINPRDFFSPDHEIFRASVRRFIAEAVAPHHADWEAAGIVPRDLWLQAGAAGLLCCDIPEAQGGPGGDFLHNVIVAEEFAAAGYSGPGFSIHSDMVSTYLTKFGSDAQRQTWLPKMVTGAVIGAIAMTEPGAGSDLRGMATQARADGGDYVISGQKTYISNGQLCDLVIVAAKTAKGSGGRSISLFIVETDRPGFARGRNLEKIGARAQDTSELFFDAVRVPAANRLGAEGDGFGMLVENLARERLIQAVRGAAAAEAAIAWTIDFARERRLFDKSLGEFQNTRFVMADLATKAAACRALVDRCIQQQLAGQLDPIDAGMAKIYATEFQGETVDRCLQFHGGAGYMLESPIARAYADARVARIAGGAVEAIRETIGRRLFGR